MTRQPIPLWDGPTPGTTSALPPFTPTITPMAPESSETLPAVIVIPGGGYCRCAPHEGPTVGEWLHSLGFAAFVVEYRTSPHRHPGPVLDGQRAVRWVRAHADKFNIDKNRVGMIGFSAGGHLTSTVGTLFDTNFGDIGDEIDRESCRPDAMVLCYAVLSLTEHAHQGCIDNLLGSQALPAQRRKMSSYRNVTPQTPPTFLWHTATDAAVPVENSLMFAQALRANKVPFELHIFPEGNHGLGLADGDPHVGQWKGLCAEWLRRTL